jgi:hypothetical protein
VTLAAKLQLKPGQSIYVAGEPSGYPKARQLGTDLNRDSLWELLVGDGIRPVRQIAIDDTWFALRFRQA